MFILFYFLKHSFYYLNILLEIIIYAIRYILSIVITMTAYMYLKVELRVLCRYFGTNYQFPFTGHEFCFCRWYFQ